jgi:hypothetical protein
MAGDNSMARGDLRIEQDPAVNATLLLKSEETPIRDWSGGISVAVLQTCEPDIAGSGSAGIEFMSQVRQALANCETLGGQAADEVREIGAYAETAVAAFVQVDSEHGADVRRMV